MTDTKSEGGQSVGAIPLVIYCAYLWLQRIHTRIRGVHLMCLAWALMMPFVNVMGHGVSSGYVLPLLFPMLFEVTYMFAQNGAKVVRRLCRLFLLVALITTFFFLQTRNTGDEFRQTNTIFFPLLTLPWMLLYKGEKRRFIILCIFTVLITLSLKRSSLLVMVGFWLVYFLVILKNRRNKLLPILALIGLLFLGWRAYNMADDAMGGVLSERINREETNTGRNRLAIYEQTEEMIDESSVDEKIIGHGHNTAKMDSPLQISAHNEFLEILYDYGILVFILYLYFWSFVIRRCWMLYRIRSEIFFPYAVSLCIFFVMAMVSQLVLYCSYFLYLVMFWATVEGYLKSQGLVEKRKPQ